METAGGSWEETEGWAVDLEVEETVEWLVEKEVANLELETEVGEDLEREVREGDAGVPEHQLVETERGVEAVD